MLDPSRQKQLEQLLRKLGVTNVQSVQWSLLDLALIHPSFATDANYEHLEFIGDAVVRLVTAEFLQEIYGTLPVGELAAIRSILVSDQTLAKIATSYNLDRYLVKSTAAENDRTGVNSRLADAFESVLGALYLSTKNFTLIRPWLDTHLQSLAEAIHQDPARKNYKAALQEWSQSQIQQLPNYRVQETNPTHDAPDRFTAEVWLQDQCYGQGTGRSIKAAEQAAAQQAFLNLTN